MQGSFTKCFISQNSQTLEQFFESLYLWFMSYSQQVTRGKQVLITSHPWEYRSHGFGSRWSISRVVDSFADNESRAPPSTRSLSPSRFLQVPLCNETLSSTSSSKSKRRWDPSPQGQHQHVRTDRSQCWSPTTRLSPPCRLPSHQLPPCQPSPPWYQALQAEAQMTNQIPRATTRADTQLRGQPWEEGIPTWIQSQEGWWQRPHPQKHWAQTKQKLSGNWRLLYTGMRAI